jgi:hypothetical protein
MITTFHRFFLPRGISLARERLNLKSSPNTLPQVRNSVRYDLYPDVLLLYFFPCILAIYPIYLSLSGVVLRPGFIYGKRKVDGFEIPLDLVGQPLEKLLSSVENFTKPLNALPGSDLVLASPVSVDDVAYAVINAVIDDSFFGVFTIEQIKEAAASVRV